MSFDDDMKNRFQKQTPIVSNLDDGAAAAASSAVRRTAAVRGLAAIVFLAVIGLGALSLTSDGDTNSLDVAGISDANAEDAQAEGDSESGATDPIAEETSEGGEEVTEQEQASDVVAEEPDEQAELAGEQPTDEIETEEPVDDPGAVPTVGDEIVFRVTAVASDDTLNVRAGAGTDFDVLFELAPDATGVVRTDTDPELVGQNEWVEVYGPISGTRGWVNFNFLEPIDVLDDRPCAFNETSGSVSAFANSEGTADSEGIVASTMDTFRFGSCVRTVIQFADGFSPANTVTVLPNDITVDGNTFDGVSIINFGPSLFAAEAADARFVEAGTSQSIYLHRLVDGNIVGLIYGPSSNLDVAFDNANGRIIIDVADAGTAAGGVQPLLDQNGVVLTDIFLGPDGVTISGLARPFEATLGVEVLFEGNPIDVDWTQGAIGSGTASSNGVMTTDWSSAWGAFDFTIEVIPSVNPFDLIVRMDPTGGAADDPVVVDLVLEDLLN